MAPAEQAGRLIERGEEPRQELERRLHRPDLTPRERERLEMVKAAARGQDLGPLGPGADGASARCGAGWGSMSARGSTRWRMRRAADDRPGPPRPRSRRWRRRWRPRPPRWGWP